MKKYNIENISSENFNNKNDEIDLIKILKIIIKEKHFIFITTIIFTIFSFCFNFYKNNQTHNYGSIITFSDKTIEKINQYNKYKNINTILNEKIQESFNSILNTKNSEIYIVSSENINEISNLSKENYNYIKIIDKKNKSYKIFTKIKKQNIPEIRNQIKEIVLFDSQLINKQLQKSLQQEIINLENKLINLKKETESLNNEIMLIIEKKFTKLPEKNLKENISIIAPILYIKYQEKINTLNNEYLKLINLKEIQKNEETLIELSGINNIKIISTNLKNKQFELTFKLIILLGIFTGISMGIFFAVIKEPLKNIFNELKNNN